MTAAVVPLHQSPHERWIVQWVGAMEAPLLRYVGRLVRDEGVAQDIVQDTFLKLCKQRQETLAGREKPWLYRVARNAAIDVLRKKGAVRPEAHFFERQAADTPAADEVLTAQAEAQELRRVIETLPTRQREAVWLKFVEGLSYARISEVMNTSVGNVGYLIHHGVARIRRDLDRLAAEQAPAAAHAGGTHV